MKILNLLFVLLIATTLFGQTKLDGYYVSTAGDTISGFIKSDINMDIKTVEFQKQNGETLFLRPSDASVIAGPVFGKLTSGIKEGAFVETILNGKIDMHRSKDTLILIKDNKPYAILLNEKDPNVSKETTNRNKQKGILKLLTYDAKKPLFKDNDVKFNYRSMLKIFESYNEASGGSISNYGSLNKLMVVSLGVAIGGGFTGSYYGEIKNTFDAPDPFEFGNLVSFDKNFGLSAKFRNLGRYHKLAFELSPFYSIQHLTSHLNYDTEVYNNDITSDIKMSSLNIPLIFDYSVHNTDQSYLYLNFGLNTKFNFNKSFYADITRTYRSIQGLEPLDESRDKSDELADAQFAPIVGLSYLKIGTSWEFETALRYQYLSQYMRVGPNGHNHNVALTFFFRRVFSK